MSRPQLFDGKEWIDIPQHALQPPADAAGRAKDTTNGSGGVGFFRKKSSSKPSEPIPPVPDGDGTIFVSIINYRDGTRCGKTLIDLFQQAKDPDRIIVGLLEQNKEDDLFCLEAYCKELGYNIYHKRELRQDTTKLMNTEQRPNCPRIDQIRLIAVHAFAAKGPVVARSYLRKVLGNEEYCMQLDAHMEFSNHWDELARTEWKAIGNEFGILSTAPLGLRDKPENGKVDRTAPVTRECLMEFPDTGVPGFIPNRNIKVQGLEKPLLSHSWSSAFSFAKCHLEETTPYDPFLEYIMGAEQFSRFARFWTRGYDVYTPTTNIVYHSNQPNPDGHGDKSEWMKPRFERFKDASLARIRTSLQLQEGFADHNAHNLGLYGMGRRRTVQQLADFCGLDWEGQEVIKPMKHCANDSWVPYDPNISPLENLFNKPTDLDPQPEYRLRTNFTFLNAYDDAGFTTLDMLEGDLSSFGGMNGQQQGYSSADSPFPSASLIVPLWVFGLLVWYMMFIVRSEVSATFEQAANGVGEKLLGRKKITGYKQT